MGSTCEISHHAQPGSWADSSVCSPEYAGVITKFAERLKQNMPPIIYGTGRQVRDFIHVDDVANAILAAAGRIVRDAKMTN